MDSARGRADHAEARHVCSRSEQIATRTGRLDGIEEDRAEGFGVRVLYGRRSATGVVRPAIRVSEARFTA